MNEPKLERWLRKRMEEYSIPRRSVVAAEVRPEPRAYPSDYDRKALIEAELDYRPGLDRRQR